LPAVETLDDLSVENAQQSADIIRSVLSGKAGPARDIVVANAAAAIWIAGKAETLREAAALSQRAIDSGAAKQLLERLIQATNTK
jgi:anthranilate phosphoribosyltransferase